MSHHHHHPKDEWFIQEPAPTTRRLRYHVLMIYKNFGAISGISHIGLGVTCMYNAKTLIQHGIFAQALPVKSVADLEAYIAKHEGTPRPVTHVVEMAPWIEAADLARLCLAYPDKSFALNNHSNIAFLHADTNGIRIIRDCIDLETGMPNFSVSCNNHRAVKSLEGAYGRPITYLPNIYFLHGREPIHRPIWNGGTLKIGIFGAARVQKNFPAAVQAAVELTTQLKCHSEIWMNSGRQDGPETARLRRACEHFTAGLPHVTLKFLPWTDWPGFKRAIGSMNILFQPSYTETFNNVTADGICEGVPSVVSSAIEWAPENWRADIDCSSSMAGAARRLLFDHHAAQEGYTHLKHYVSKGVQDWKHWLAKMPGGEY